MHYTIKTYWLYLLVFVLLLQPTLSEAQKVKPKRAKATVAQSDDIASAKSLLWEISGNGLKQPSYLYGTYHLLNDSYLNSVPEVKARFQQSKGVVVETEIDSSKMMQLGALMVMPDNKISALISEEDYALVDAVLKGSYGIDLSMADQMKPMTLLLMLSLGDYQKMEALKHHTGQPLDAYFASQGRKDGKKISTLETMEFQFNLLYNHFPIEKQAQQLVEYVKNKDKASQMSERLTELYFAKDLAGMWTISEEYNELTGGGDMSYMVDDRNKDWMTKLPAIMKVQSTFVAVGALHLPGQNGLLKLMQEAGYTVRPLQ